MYTLEELLKNILIDCDLSNLSTTDGLNHPLNYLLRTNESFDSLNYWQYARENTERSLNLIYENDIKFFTKEKKNNLIGCDRTNASAVLGEIRCYGALLDAFGKSQVKHVNERKESKTPDFLINLGEQQIEIEVMTLQMDGNEARNLSAFENADVTHSGDGILLREHLTRPFGNKKRSGTTPSVIYKLCSIKEDAEQLGGNKPGILWIDCQDEYMNQISPRLDIDGPIYSSRGMGSCVKGLSSNEIWYSLFAHKGDLILDGESLDSGEGIKRKPDKMMLDGKFAKKKTSKRISAAIFYGPNAMCIYENPFAKKRLPECFRIKLMGNLTFKYENSRIDFPKGQLKNKLKNDYKVLKKLCKESFYSW